MSLPVGVVLADDGAREFVTQRGYWAPPYTSCMFAALSMLLTWSGYRLPLARNRENTPPANFVLALHLASGRSLDEGSTIRDTKTALRALLPDTPILFGSMTDDEFIGELEKGAAIRVTANMSHLPTYLQRWAGGGNVNHAFAVIGSRWNSRREIFWLDPMGRPAAGYAGDWIPFSDVREHLKRTSDGELIVTVTYRGAASSLDTFEMAATEEGTMQLVNWAINRVGDVPLGTPIYDLNLRLLRATRRQWVGKPILAESQSGNYWAFGHMLAGQRVIVAVEKTNVANVRTVDPATLVVP